MKKLLLLFLLSAFPLFSFSASAVDRIAASAALGDVQSAVNAAADGDRVLIPNGSATWSGGINTTKQIKIEAQNYTATPAGTSGPGTSSRNVTIVNNSSSPLLQFQSGNSYNVGVAGIRFNEGSGSGAHIWFSGTGSKIPTINDCYFENKIRQWPTQPCLRFAGKGGVMWNSVMQGTGSIGSVGEGSCVIKWEDSAIRPWNTASTMGMLDVNGDVNVYFEDCTFNNVGNMPDIDQNGRFVGRRLVYDGSWAETHGYTSGGVGGRHWEYYDSIFRGTTANRNISARYFWCRQGTGVFTGNECRGDNVGYGTPSQLQIGDTQGAAGYPTPKQPGWGHNGTTDVSDPIYIWNQTGSAAYSWGFQGSSWQSLVQLNRDIFVNNGAKPGWTRYTYPHPVRGGTPPPDTTPPVISGTNVSAITATSVTIGWATDESTTNALDYGTPPGTYTATLIISAYNASFSQLVSGLSASTSYGFRIRAGDVAGNKSTNTLATTTAAVDSTAPTISGTNIININQNGATFVASVSEQAYSGVVWTNTANGNTGTATNGATLSLSPSVTFNGATAASLVRLRFWVSDVSGNTNSVVASFTTSAAPPSGNQTYYVDQSAGNDNNSGLAGQPWKNCPGMSGTSAYTGSGQLLPGDTVYFDKGDTWLVSNNSGGGLTLFRGVRYVGDQWGTGTRAHIQANGRCDAGIVRFNGDHPTIFTDISGFEIDGAVTNSATGIDGNHAYWQIGMTGATKIISNNVVHSLYGDSSLGDYKYGIIISDHSGDASGWTANWLIVDCSVTGAPRDGICLYPGETGMISNINVRGCYVNFTATDPNYSEGHGILVKGLVKDSTVEWNYVPEASSSAVFVNGPESGAGNGPTNLSVRHNILNTSDNNGVIRLYGTGYFKVDVYGNICGGTSSSGMFNMSGYSGNYAVNVLNNTFIKFVDIGNPSGSGTLNWSNNIVWAVGATPLTDAGSDIDNHGQNTYYRSGSGTTLASIGGSSYTSGTITGWEPSALSSNPLFSNTNSLPTGFTGNYGSTLAPNTTGLSLQAGSPSIDSGATLPATYNRSINSITRAAPWDRGAYETADTPPAISGTNVTNIAFDRAVAVATTSEIAYGGVAWGYNTSVTNGFSTNATTLNTSHSLLFTGTTASTFVFVKWFFTDVSGLTTNALMSYTSAAAPASTPIPPPIGVRVTPSAP